MSTSPYKNSVLYDASRICADVEAALISDSYADRQLQEKIRLVESSFIGGTLVDLGCASGRTLNYFLGMASHCIGIDFSERYIKAAIKSVQTADGVIHFIVGDVRAIPLCSTSVDLAYSFATLYHVDGLEAFCAEVSRILRPGGRCVLDLGNRDSLNMVCGRYYAKRHGYAEMKCVSVTDMLRLCSDHGLAVIEHKSFQLLPLWANRPRWLYPFLHPAWTKLMARRVRGKMIDEWVSSLPFLRKFAFRHLIVCEKR